ncbi:MAG: hypothetical protein AAF387_03085 [Pseudomonadota bacterium]
MQLVEPLLEIPEDTASGVTAEIYEDIRRTLALRNVNLIYRHFATLEQALPAVWLLVRPYFIDKKISAAATKIKPLLSTNIDAAAFPGEFPYDEKLKDQVANVLDFYLSANPMNLIALEILTIALESAGEDLSSNTGLLPIGELESRVESTKFVSENEGNMFLVSQGMSQVRPTLLRQLEEWPQFLAAVSPLIKRMCLSDSLFSLVENIRNNAKESAVDIFTRGEVSMPESSLKSVANFCGYFPKILIRMTIIAAALRRSL